jgi:eukaryotic-like serine/threonine-protein kinase
VSRRINKAALVVAALALLGGTPAILVALHINDTAVLAVATAMAAVVVALGIVWQDRYRRQAREHDAQALQIKHGCLTVGNQLPKVHQVQNPVYLGVHVSPPISSSRNDDDRKTSSDDVPPYIPRDIDAQIREHLANGGFVLIVGDSAAGKSRAAYEAMRTTVPDHMLIAPQNREALSAALAHAGDTRKCVLWLDGLETYLGTAGLTRNKVVSLLAGDGHHRLIIATLRTAEEIRYRDDMAVKDMAVKVDAQRDLREVLELASEGRIMLPRLFSSAEKKRAEARTRDRRIAEALVHADTYGVAEYLAAGPELLHDWENARNSSAGPHARGAALVAAAIDIRRAGQTSPILGSLLDKVHEYYLSDPEHVRIPCEPIIEAWAWATMRRRATTALLQPAGEDHVEVFDYLVDSIQRRCGPGNHVPEPVIQAAMDLASPADADSLAATAYAQGRYSLAEYGWRNSWHANSSNPSRGPDHPDTLASRDHRAMALGELGRLREAQAEHRAVLNARVRLFGADDSQSLASRNNVACSLHLLGLLQAAETEFRATLEARTRLMGPDHDQTLIVRLNRAVVLEAMGRLEEAEGEVRAVIDARDGQSSVDELDIISSRSILASVLRQLGRHDEAETQHRAVLDARVQMLGPDHPDALLTRFQLAIDLSEQDRLEEAEGEHRTTFEAFARVLGPDHLQTYGIRNQLAGVLRRLGRHDEAETEHRAVLAAFTNELGPDHPDTLIARSYLAAALADLDRLEEAEIEYRAALEGLTRVLGTEHPETRACQTGLARVLHRL